MTTFTWNYALQDLVKTFRLEWIDKFSSRFFFRLLSTRKSTFLKPRSRATCYHSLYCTLSHAEELRLEEMGLKGRGIVQKGWFLLISSASDGILETCLWWYWDHLLMDFWFDRNWSFQIQPLSIRAETFLTACTDMILLSLTVSDIMCVLTAQRSWRKVSSPITFISHFHFWFEKKKEKV